MKIDVKDRGKKEYYEEVLYIATKYNSIRKNPKKKVYRIIPYLICYDLFLILSIILITVFYLDTYDRLYIFLLGALFVFLFLSILLMISFKKRIDIFMNIDGVKSIIIDEEEVSYEDKEKRFNVKWDDIESVIIHKYSISFIPKSSSVALISISTDYKKEVLKALKKYKKESLIVE